MAVTAPITPAASLTFEHSFAESLPEMAKPTPTATPPAPRLLALNTELAHELGLGEDFLASDEGLRLLTGQNPLGQNPPAQQPVAQVYAGHQWGVYKPILGDGRAALIGEVRTRAGTLVDLHLKGIGPTPMSRVDGFAGIAPMLREHLMGEAMHALGVPTTRALAVTATGATHERKGVAQPGAVLARIAASHLRIGSVQYAHATGNRDLLRRVADHAIARLYPHLAAADAPYRELYAAIVDAHARLTAQWMSLGFVHGVLSTDNVTLSGETIDYGPCAFIDRFDPHVWFSSIDEHGRYAYDRQPSIMAWNLEKLGEALGPLLGESAGESAAVIEFETHRFLERVAEHRLELFTRKLGLDAPASVTGPLIDDALAHLEDEAVDFTSFFRALASAAAAKDATGDHTAVTDSAVTDLFLDRDRARAWLSRWHALRPDEHILSTTNPVYVPRNGVLDDALDAAAAGDLGDYEELLSLVTHPFTPRPGTHRKHTEPTPADAPAHRTFCGT